MKTAFTTIDAYLKTVPLPHRQTLETLRERLHAVAPGAEECISYGMPALRYNGKIMVWFAAAKAHCALYPGGMVISRLSKELANYGTSRGTIRFEIDRCLPMTLVKTIVKMRITDLGQGKGVRTKEKKAVKKAAKKPVKKSSK